MQACENFRWEQGAGIGGEDGCHVCWEDAEGRFEMRPGSGVGHGEEVGRGTT